MRLHPLSVPYRVASRAGSVATTVAVLLIAGSSGLGPLGDPVVLGAVLAVAVVAVVGWEVAYYRRFEYELTDGTVDITAGVVSRQHREIPLARVQNVDVRQNPVQRILGIASVAFETAGGESTEASLEYVSYEEAQRLRRGVRGGEGGGGAEAGDAGAAGQTDGAEVVFELPDRELLLLSAVSVDPRVLSAAVFLAPLATGLFPGGLGGAAGTVLLLSAGLLLLVATWLAGAARTFERYYGFRLTREAGDLRYERGLFRRYDGTIPTGKLQTLTIQENPLMRRLGYAALAVETAGYAAGQSPSGGSAAAVPLARRGEVVAIARRLEPFESLDLERPPGRARRRYAIRYALAGALATGVAYGVHALLWPLGAWWAAPLALVAAAPAAARVTWRHRGHALLEDHVVTRNGFWRRSTTVVPYYRVQTVITRQTVFQRRYEVATVVFDTAGSRSLGGRDARAVDVDADRAETLRETVHDRLQAGLTERRRARAAGSATDGPLDAGEPDRETPDGAL